MERGHEDSRSMSLSSLDLFLQVATLSYNQLAKIGSYAESQINIWQQGMEFPRLA